MRFVDKKQDIYPLKGHQMSVRCVPISEPIQIQMIIFGSRLLLLV